MESSVRHALSVIALASVAFTTVGCSHDPLGSGTNNLAVSYTPSPSGAGRYTPTAAAPDDRATFVITTIRALPVDPAAAAIFGSETLLFRFATFTVDLTATTAVAFSEIVLAEGTYRVTLLRITPPALIDNDVSANPQTCIEGVAVVNSSSAPGVPGSLDFVNSPSLTFTVRPGQTTLALKINVPGLIAGYESAFTCQDDCGGGSPCLTAFNEASYRAAVLANVTLE